MAYSEDLKRRAVEYLEEGNTIKETCKVFKIGKTALIEWRKLLLAGETLQGKPRKRKSKVYPAEKLQSYVETHPQATLSEIAEYFGGTISGADTALRRLKITLKKRQQNT